MCWYSFFLGLVVGIILGMALLGTILLIVDTISNNQEIHKRLLEIDKEELQYYKEQYKNCKHIIDKYSDVIEEYNEIIAEHNENTGGRK